MERVIAGAFSSAFLFGVWLSGCTLPPQVSPKDCHSLCSDQGKGVKLYRVGSAVPIVKRRPPVICECD